MDRPKVLVTSRLFPQAEEFLLERTEAAFHRGEEPVSYHELQRLLAGKQGLLCMLYDRVDAGIMDGAPHLRVIANMAAGLDNIDVEEATRRCIVVTHTPGILTEATAELGWALLMATARLIPQAHQFTLEGRFRGWRPYLFLGKSLEGKTLGIYGMGRIGMAVARRAVGFDMRIIYHNRKPNLQGEKGTGACYVSFQELISQSDFLMITAPLTSETRGRFGLGEFRQMKRDAVIINIGRGPIVKESELAQALRAGIIWGAGLDVYEMEPEVEPGLLESDRVVLLSHIGSATVETRFQMAMAAAKDLTRVLKGEAPLSSPNWTAVKSML